ncbi:hypothetical protein [Sphingobacterium lactis]|uniref:Uncharacterized protein n=1 Tax=Sphingobacterium lactis TaxID=797291 RepID=A0A1H6BFF3_9SPHI|nr:hypothetical protein [Sphingobacterium lactis]SEG59027.1 hypothetical protein SAMN05421877_11058 [Sphingobacterium lactis]
MFHKRNNSSKSQTNPSGKAHPFIKRIKAQSRAVRKISLLQAVLNDLKVNNFVFSNN